MKHPRLDELLVDFSWTNETVTSSEFGSGVVLRDWEVWTTLDGRRVSFFHWQAQRLGFSWGCSAAWSPGMRRRHRKQVKKRTAELVGLALEPSDRRVLESVPLPLHVGVEERFLVGSAGLFYGLAGDPPPAGTIIAIVEVLVETATRIQAMFDAAP